MLRRSLQKAGSHGDCRPLYPFLETRYVHRCCFTRKGDRPQAGRRESRFRKVDLQHSPRVQNGRRWAYAFGKSKSRVEFLKSLTAKCPAMQEGNVGRQLRKEAEEKLLKLAADVLSKPKEKTPTDADKPPDSKSLLSAMPKTVRQEARKMLNASDLMDRVIDDIGRLGVAGEEKLSATTYLIGTSRLLPEPLAAIVQGPSSSGKSYVIKKVARLFPPEAVILATQMTPQALFYMPARLSRPQVCRGRRTPPSRERRKRRCNQSAAGNAV